MRPGSLLHRVGSAIADRRLWRAGDRVAVAVSGGLDSVCLLDLLLETQRWHGGQLSVATVDHGTRCNSDSDADFVEALATGRGLRCTRTNLALGASASENSCRDARYAFFDQLDVDTVALAHHRDDQAETVLLQLLRGTGIRGLAGMGFKRGRYVRPMLQCSRAELSVWAQQRGLAWVEDPTNGQPQFLRNRVRAEVLPLLEAIRPGAAAALARTATLVALDAELVDKVLASNPDADPGPYGWRRAWMAEAPEALVRRALSDALPGVVSAHIDAILTMARRGEGAIQIDRSRTVRADAEHVWVEVGEQLGDEGT